MYTATKLGGTVDRQTRQIIVTVRFADGESQFDRDFKFGLNTTVEEQKLLVKRFLDDLNKPTVSFADGEVDFTGVVESTPTQAELDKQEWFRDFNRLERVQILIDLTVLTGNETAVTNLRNKVKTNFKPAYIADM